MTSYRQLLQEKHLKVTPQRCVIYEVLANATTHPTADEILATVKRRLPMISPNTVYYTLGVFEAAGLVIPINDKTRRYDANLIPHHHLICLTCGMIDDIYDDSLNQLGPPRTAVHHFQIFRHRVEFYGQCQDCHLLARGLPVRGTQTGAQARRRRQDTHGRIRKQ